MVSVNLKEFYFQTPIHKLSRNFFFFFSLGYYRGNQFMSFTLDFSLSPWICLAIQYLLGVSLKKYDSSDIWMNG